MIEEFHTMKSFRGTDLGIIRLNKLAITDNPKMEITIGDERIYPIGFDTYGHPIISSQNYAYYKALKKNYDRDEKTFLLKVTYEYKAFCIRLDVFNEADIINSIANGNSLRKLKEILMLRKQYNFCKKNSNSKNELKCFIIFGRYLLETDGHVYLWDEDNKKKGPEVHIPGEDDVCATCGKHFNIQDVRDANITEDDQACKYHKSCYDKYVQELQLCKASQIMDVVYENIPSYDIIPDNDGNEKFNWYCYHTTQGDIALRFKTKVISIKWYDNFKPFDVKKVFKKEPVTKFNRGIHAWSPEDAIRYLSMAKEA